MDYSVFQKPFPSYRWRWGALTPSEGLNIPEVNFGCLKVLYDNQGLPPNADSVEEDLQRVQDDLADLNDTGRPLRLARGTERNLFRNSGQYWKLSGLLSSTNGGISLSEFGIGYAAGNITRSEFASYIVKTLNLPNRHIENQNEVDIWQTNSVEITPLELILTVIVLLYEADTQQGYLTAEELSYVIIPLSGNGCSSVQLAQGVLDYRANPVQFSGTWVANDGDNDERIAREFLLFLSYYEFLGIRNSTIELGNSSNSMQEFYLYEEQLVSIKSLIDLDHSTLDSIQQPDINVIEAAIELDQKTQVIDAARERKQVDVLARPSQTKFRKDVLEAGKGLCVLSGVTIKEALQACHIIPVKNNGSDDKSNGFIIRADLHTLYDKGHIRISEDGNVNLSDYLNKDEYYSDAIPSKIIIPDYVSKEAIRMRNEYSM